MRNHQMRIRLPAEIVADIARSAQESGTSMNAEINARLEQLQEVTSFLARLPSHLHGKLRVAAAKNGTSLNAEIVSRLYASLEG